MPVTSWDGKSRIPAPDGKGGTVMVADQGNAEVPAWMLGRLLPLLDDLDTYYRITHQSVLRGHCQEMISQIEAMLPPEDI